MKTIPRYWTINENSLAIVLPEVSLPSCVFCVFNSEATQCITLFSRQGTNDTIDEVEDEQDPLHDHDERPEHVEEAETGPWSSIEPELEKEKRGEELEPEKEEPEEAEWEPEDHKEEEQDRPEDDGEVQSPQREDGESSGRELVPAEKASGQLFTPDTDVLNTSDADVPPSYSKAVSFDRLSVDSEESDEEKQLMLMTSDSRSDLLSDDALLPSQTTELTASELLLNK